MKNLPPRAFINYFRDGRIEYTPWRVKLRGVAVGDGDFDMKGAYKLIKANPEMDRINIELDMEEDLDSMENSLNLEKTALDRSVKFCRNVLGVGEESE